MCAILFGEKTEKTLSYGDHATTFGGNPICAAAAYSIIKRMDDKFLDSVKEKGAYIKEKLLACDKVKSVSGKGLMIGIELNTEKSSKDVAMKCIENGLIILTAKAKLRLLPPLSITKEEIDKGLNILINVLKEV